ncbi:DNA-packaging protein [Olsenella sp. Marseille-P4559]|uniref:phage head-tail connector protein n=1 Tax=Olsenella sp. Marseille-P4559 TaxID=2364795 RepID=UPI0010308CE5|nr:DNA-packaging protein [Olsenella sp. Marseille-P4559]
MADSEADLLAACRAALRIPADCSTYDGEIADLIDAARSALRAGGVTEAMAASNDDSSVCVAIKVYVKANFGMDNPDAERLMQSFRDMLCRMAGSSEHGTATKAGAQ